ncbi:uncharacterized protein LOC130668337 isoform X1 [Microplitis mediator]|uniref:uncharacterized protein LOC130668337 isoform X1 n=1 Tax=Microplitis mediator TaxID=375433 RepID=UPI0025551FCD|nr:uncharacterized protein LOC130668337 isoform X1 [Microplitis mediator]
MCHTLHIFLCGLICFGIFDYGNTAENPVITPNLLSSLAANVGTVLSSSLLKEIHGQVPNRTAVRENSERPFYYDLPTPLPPGPPKPKPTRLTSSTKKPKVAAVPNSFLVKAPEDAENIRETPDSLRAPQTQLENQFPFDFRNNFRDFGTGFQGTGRQLSGPLGGQPNGQLNGQLNAGGFGGDQFNSDIYRPFASLDGSRANENIPQGAGSPFAGRDADFNGGNRPFNYAGNPQDFNRFQDFGRFGFNGQFPGSNRYFDPSSRQGANQFSNFAGQDPRVLAQQNYPQDPRALAQQNNPQDPRALAQQNYPQDPRANLQNPNDQSGLAYPQNYPNSFPQNYAPNSFNFLANQRFQGPFNGNFDRNPQDGLNYPPYFPGRPDGVPGPQSPGNSNPNQQLNINGQINSQSGPGPINSSRRSEETQRPARKPVGQKTTTTIPDVESLQERLQLEKLFYPPVNDYSDVRINSDAFKQHSVASNVVDKNPKTNIV